MLNYALPRLLWLALVRYLILKSKVFVWYMHLDTLILITHLEEPAVE
jgi:hypothetical protein